MTLARIFQAVFAALKSEFSRPLLTRARIRIHDEAALARFVSISLGVIFFLIPVSQTFPYAWVITGPLITASAFIAFHVLLAEREASAPSRNLVITDLGEELLRSVDPQGNLELDYAAYTAETLEETLKWVADHIGIANTRIRTLRIRVLVWDPRSASVLPHPLSDSCQKYDRNEVPDEEYRSVARNKTGQHITRARAAIRTICRECKIGDPEQSFQVRYSPFEPSFKAAVINQERVLFTLYKIEEVPDAYPEQKRTSWDHEGRFLTLQELPKDGPLAVSVQDWFHKVWETFSSADLK